MPAVEEPTRSGDTPPVIPPNGFPVGEEPRPAPTLPRSADVARVCETIEGGLKLLRDLQAALSRAERAARQVAAALTPTEGAQS